MIPFTEIKNNKYYLTQRVGKESIIHKELTDLEASDIQEALRIFGEYIYCKRRISQIELNLNEFFQVINNTEKKLLDKPLKKISDFEIITIEINRVFDNFIISLSTFIETIEGRLQRRYGEESTKFKEFKSFQCSCYDGNFTYRFFYHLRNFSVHHDFSLHNIKMEYEYDVHKKIKSGELKVQFEKNHLLGNKKMRKKLAADLKFYNDVFPVIPILRDFKAPLKSLTCKFLELEFDYFYSAFMIFENFNPNEIIDFGLSICNFDDKNIVWKTNYFPTDYIIQFKNDLKSNLYKKA
ncbi:MAG: hypothetical protein KAT68_11575 [Bacteroidales bacterium]|nr:hypothetical protein [Bacteroidales bacterium]